MGNELHIKYSHVFEKQLAKAPNQIQQAFLKRRALFEEDSRSPQLRNHALAGKWQGYRSFNVTGDWRALYTIEESEREIQIIFKALGTHSQLYR